MKSSQWGCDCYSSHFPLSIAAERLFYNLLLRVSVSSGVHTPQTVTGVPLITSPWIALKASTDVPFKGVTLRKCQPYPLGTVHEMRCLAAVENSFYRCHHTSAAWKCRSGESAKEASCVFFLWVSNSENTGTDFNDVCQSTVNLCPQWRNFHMIIRGSRQSWWCSWVPEVQLPKRLILDRITAELNYLLPEI